MNDTNLIVDPCSMKMALRKGDTGTACFRFDEYLEEGTVWFVVKESIKQPDSEAPIYKKWDFKGGSLLLIKVTEEESDKLSFGEVNSSCPRTRLYKDYIWAIKYAEHLKDENGNFVGLGSVITIIPRGFEKPPIFRVYPEIIEGPNSHE